MNNAKKQRKTIEWETRGLFKKTGKKKENWRYQGNISCKGGHDKGH